MVRLPRIQFPRFSGVVWLFGVVVLCRVPPGVTGMEISIEDRQQLEMTY